MDLTIDGARCTLRTDMVKLTKVAVSWEVLRRLKAAAAAEGLTPNAYLSKHLPHPQLTIGFVRGEDVIKLLRTAKNENRALLERIAREKREDKARIGETRESFLQEYDKDFERRYLNGEEDIQVDERVEGLSRKKHEHWVSLHTIEIDEYYRAHCPAATMRRFRLHQEVLRAIVLGERVYGGRYQRKRQRKPDASGDGQP